MHNMPFNFPKSYIFTKRRGTDIQSRYPTTDATDSFESRKL